MTIRQRPDQVDRRRPSELPLNAQAPDAPPADARPRQRRRLSGNAAPAPGAVQVGQQQPAHGHAQPQAARQPQVLDVSDPAPAARLHELPQALQVAVAQQLSVRDIQALRGSSHALRAAMRNHAPLRQTFESLQRLVVGASGLLDRADFRDAGHLTGAVKLLGLLSTQDRARVVNAAMALRDDTERADVVRALAGRATHLDPGQREAIVCSTSQFEEHSDRALALHGFGAGMAHWTQRQILHLFDATLRLGPTGPGATAISGLLEGAAHLDAEQRIRLVKAAFMLVEAAFNSGPLDPDDELGAEMVLSSLASASEHLDESQRNKVLAAVMLLDDGLERATGIAGLGEGAAHLNPAQRENLVHAVHELADPWSRAIALEGIGKAVGHFNALQRERMVKTALRLSDAQSTATAVAGLGRGAAHLTTSQLQDLAAAAIGLESPVARATAIAGLGRAIPHLAAPRRAELMAAATELEDDIDRATALVGLACGAGHLSAPDRQALVNAALGLNEQHYQHKAALIANLVNAINDGPAG